ncbi:hypothetical protein [Halpernia sp. GG3]
MAREPFVAKLSAIWIGAIFFWILTGFNKKYSELLNEKYETRNLLTGYIITLVVTFIIVYFSFVN